MMYATNIIYTIFILLVTNVPPSVQAGVAAAVVQETADSVSAVAAAALDDSTNNSNGSGTGINRLTCAQSMMSVDHLADDEVAGDQDGNTVPIDTVTQLPYVTCEEDSKYCYALWHEEVTNGSARIIMMGQGCWETSGKPDNCERTECVNDRKPSNDQNAKKFCCCSSDMCNSNVSNAYNSNYVEDNTVQNNSVVPCAAVSDKNLPYILLYSFAAAIPICMLLVVCTCYLHKQKKKSDLEMGAHDCLGGTTSSGILLPADYNLEKLKLTEIVIGEGRYGRVLKASLGCGDNQRDVAVKVFPADHRNYYNNEYELYRVAGEHPHLVRCFGSRDRAMVELTAALESTASNRMQYMLVLSLEQESLQEYLTREIVDLNVLCRMTLGIAKGLAHLHCDLGKQCIAHRDLNTKNILVTSDLNCRICDLGLAVVPRRTENKVLSEAGTLRYMAPEVLEGAVNLRDCESALRQIDVYALGLVLWEVSSRCSELQGDIEPEPYVPPFHRELRGATPTLEQMQTLVTKHKARPLWPPNWSDGVLAAARLIRETTEDCWDQDAEARLTSLCVEERLLELPTLRGRIVGGHLHHVILASPTALINNNHLHDQHNSGVNATSVGSGDDGGSTTHIGSLATIEASVGTIDTLLSPSSEDNNCKNSNTIIGGSILPYGANVGLQEYYMNRLTAPPNHENYIQPYQGRNPCMERNLRSESSDGPLIDKSAKHNSNSETQNLLTNDFLNAMNQRNPRAMPIPYLQNAVHATPENQPQNRSVKQNSMAANAKTNKFISFRGLKKFFHSKKDQGSLSLLKDTQVRMIPSKLVNNSGNYGQNGVTTSLLKHEENNPTINRRPTSLTLSTSTCNSESKPTSAGVSQLLRAAAANTDDKLNNIQSNLSRQRSLEQFSEVFTSVTDLSRLKDPSVRVKTPGDVPASVRRTRGKAAKQSVTRFSLYDDRMMTQWGSAPDLDPPAISGDSTVTAIATVSARTAQTVVQSPMLDLSEKSSVDTLRSVSLLTVPSAHQQYTASSATGYSSNPRIQSPNAQICVPCPDALRSRTNGDNNIRLPSYLSLACTVNGYSTTTNYDPERLLSRSRDPSPHRLTTDSNGPTYTTINSLLSPPNLVPLPNTKTMNYTSTKTSSTAYLAKDTNNRFVKSMFENENRLNTVESNGILRSAQLYERETVDGYHHSKQLIEEYSESKSFIEQRVERLYGPGALAQGFFLTKRRRNRSFNDCRTNTHLNTNASDAHSKSFNDTHTNYSGVDTKTGRPMKQNAGSPALPVLRHLRPEFRAQLPALSPRKIIAANSNELTQIQKSGTVSVLKDTIIEAVVDPKSGVNGHRDIEDGGGVVATKRNGLDRSNNADVPKIVYGINTDAQPSDPNTNSTNSTNATAIKDGHYFLQVLQREADRLLALAEQAEELLVTEANLSEDITGLIRSTSGKARLLVSQKMQQFKGLCTNNINRNVGEAFPTTNEDLQGFWDMVMLQVDQVDCLFQNLDKLKANKWVEERVEVPKSVASAGVRKVVYRRPISSTPKTGVAEEARKQRELQRKRMIEECRKTKRELKQQSVGQEEVVEIFVPENS